MRTNHSDHCNLTNLEKQRLEYLKQFWVDKTKRSEPQPQKPQGQEVKPQQQKLW